MKVTTKSNFRIEIYPRRLADFGFGSMSDRVIGSPEVIEQEYEERCDEMIEQIKRHVDYVSSCEIVADKESYCSHCGLSWEEEENGEPLCCEQAYKEWKKGKKI